MDFIVWYIIGTIIGLIVFYAIIESAVFNGMQRFYEWKIKFDKNLSEEKKRFDELSDEEKIIYEKSKARQDKNRKLYYCLMLGLLGIFAIMIILYLF